MNLDDLQELNELLEQIRSMKVHAPSHLRAALKKPLLLLLLVSRIENDRVEENQFHFDREDLGLDRLDSRRRPQRDRQFMIDVLENFRYSCAFCGFHAVLNGVATGVDAAHVHWHSLHGPDDVENGIALCKLHHWAFDKGILGIDDEARICIADAFVAQQSGGLPLES